MKAREIADDFGGRLKELREDLDMPLDVVVEFLKDLKIKCSKASLSRIENNIVVCRMDIFAGLCLIYETRADRVLFTTKKQKKRK